MTATETAVQQPLPLLDRDLSWLEFNRRVLHEAEDDRTPLLERLKFLAIVSSNLDEFFMKRVGLLTHKLAHEAVATTLEPTPSRQHQALRATIRAIMAAQAQVYMQVILPNLAQHGIYPLN